MRAFEELKAAVGRIERIAGEYGSIVSARRIPAERVAAIRNLEIKASYHTSDKLKGVVNQSIQAMREQFEAEALRDGEIERDRVLRRIAAELESLRAALPGLAARASIEIGVLARDLSTEANKGAR